MQGSIRKRGKGSWELTIDLGRDPQGKRVRKFVHVKGSRAAADRRLRELLAQLDRGLPVSSPKLTVADYLENWHRDYVRAHTRPRTADRYRSDIRGHLVPHLGHKSLAKLVPADVQQMESSLLSEGLSPRSVEHVHRVLSEACKHAVRHGITWRNPCDSVQPPRKPSKEVSVPDVPTVLRLLDGAKETSFHSIFHFLAYSGTRRGEACGLKWRDVDLEKGLVSITQAATKAQGQEVMLAPPKSEKGRRSVTLDPETVEVLRAQRGSQLIRQVELGEIYEENGLVFPDQLGRLMNPDVISGAWRQLCRRARVTGVRLHDLRHFHATMLFRAGIHPKVVQERLGHSVISVTLDTYSHVVPGLQEEAASAFAREMRRA